MRHCFEITQDISDSIVMIAIGLVLNAGVVFKKTYITVKVQDHGVSNIISYFFNTMKGMKSLEYRI